MNFCNLPVTIITLAFLSASPGWCGSVGDLPVQDVIVLSHDRAVVSAPAFYPLSARTGDALNVLIEIDDPSIAEAAPQGEFRVVVPPAWSSAPRDPNSRRVSVPFTIAGLQCGETGYSVTMTDQNGMVFRGRGMIQVGLDLNPRSLTLLRRTEGEIEANLVSGGAHLIRNIRGRCIPDLAEILYDGNSNKFRVAARDTLGKARCGVEVTTSTEGKPFTKWFDLQVVDTFSIEEFPTRDLFIGQGWSREVISGPTGALDYYGYSTDRFWFSVSSADNGQSWRLKLPWQVSPTPCTRNQYMLNCADNYIRAVIMGPPGPTQASIEISAPLAKGMGTEKIEGTYMRVGPAAQTPRTQTPILDRWGGLVDLTFPDPTGDRARVRNGDRLLLRTRGGADDGNGSSAKQQALEDPLTAELALTDGSVVTLQIPPNDAPGMREIEIESDSGGIVLMQEGSDSTRPLIARTGLVEGAAFTPGFVSAGWASILGDFSIEGSRTWGDDDFISTPAAAKRTVTQGATLLPMSLDGVSVTVGGKPAFVQFISNGQINVLIDDDETLGPLDVVVTTPNGVSLAKTVTKVAFHPQFFRFDPEGRVHVAGVHLDGTFLGPAGLFGEALTTRPASPGDTVQLFGTGWGPTSPPTPTGQLVTAAAVLANPVTVTIGGVEATVQFAGLVGSGLNQLNVVIPDLPPGQYPLDATIGGVRLSALAVIAIE